MPLGVGPHLHNTLAVNMNISQGVENMTLNEGHKKKKWRHAHHTFDNNDGVNNATSQVPTAPPQQQFQQQHHQSQAPPLQNWQPQDAHVDPSQGSNFPSLAIPSLPRDRDEAQRSLGPNPLFKTFENACPPPACTRYSVLDQGISSPEYARLTMYNVPATEQLRSSTQLPLGLQIQPFAQKRDGSKVAVADFTQIDPPRCRRCRTYINPSMLFVEGGTKFVCNMCQFSNPVQGDYYQPTDASNRRIDWESRPELAFGSYDLEVPQAYWKDEVQPTPLRHMFVIDVSVEAVKKGLPKLAVEAIRSTLYGVEGQKYVTEGCKVGIMTFDRTVHFYNLHPNLSQAQMIVMSDLDEAFVPIEDGLFVDPEESRNVIEDLLDRIDIVFAENKTAEPAFGAVLEACHKALEHTGGKVSATLSALPTWGPGNLYFREDQQHKVETEKEMLAANNQYYVNMGKKYATAGIGLDLFVFPSSYIDLANTGEVCRASGGQEFFYPRFVPERDGRKFIADFCKANRGDEFGTQAIVKVRCSNGLQVEAYYGNFYQQDSAADPFVGIISPQTTIGVLFKYDGKLDTRLDAHFQFALLYTSASGKRMVRIHNILASVTEQQYKPVINFVDVDACMGIAARNALSKIGSVPLKEIRFGLNEKIIEIFASYRKMTGSNQPSSQLLMPISLRSLMIYFLSLQKSRPIRGTHVFSDGRVHASRLMNTLNPDELSLYLYPRIISIHNYRPEDCEYDEHTGQFNMPENLEATSSRVEEGGVYLVYNGQSILLWFHKQVSPLLLQDLFGSNISQLQDINPYLNELPQLDTDINRKTRNLLAHFAYESHTSFLAIQLARQGLDGAEHEYHAMMVEDRNMDTYNYVDYVSHIHRHVKIAMENKNTKTATLLNDTINLTHGL